MLYANRTKIKKTLSKDRLNGYFNQVKKITKAPCSLKDAYVYYSWNTLLSESLYSSLQALEVALRNSINNAANNHFHKDWLTDPKLIRAYEMNYVNNAIQSLQRKNKHVDTGRIIAELNFGFWTSLFKRTYEHTFWHPLLKVVFPHAPRKLRNRQYFSARLNKIRDLRNRVYHYEPIWYYHLEKWHDEFVQILGWMEPAMVELLEPVDRFPECIKKTTFNSLKTKISDGY